MRLQGGIWEWGWVEVTKRVEGRGHATESLSSHTEEFRFFLVVSCSFYRVSTPNSLCKLLFTVPPLLSGNSLLGNFPSKPSRAIMLPAGDCIVGSSTLVCDSHQVTRAARDWGPPQRQEGTLSISITRAKQKAQQVGGACGRKKIKQLLLPCYSTI